VLRDPVCVFYLVLRALDTVEDDMAFPVEKKIPLLRSFHERCGDEAFTIACGYGPYVDLMRLYPLVARVFNSLDPSFASVVADITRRMGNGMADFIEKEVVTVADYDLYCHYVAGLVGVGLSDLFASSGLETHADVVASPSLSNHMALVLQKTNIVRDYLEDINEEPAPRMFWPRDVWGLYASSLDEFKDPAAAAAALKCLNHMILDALRHAEPALSYMAAIDNPDVFRFCAIPQVMAAATLAACYNNYNVFTGVVKMRRGRTARIMLECNTVADVRRAFARAAAEISSKAATAAAAGDPIAAQVVKATAKLQQACARGLGVSTAEAARGDWCAVVARLLLCAALAVLLAAALHMLPASLPLAPAWVALALLVAAWGVQPAVAALIAA
jgi:farnesyl-diphosphate farnesyltransferase